MTIYVYSECIPKQHVFSKIQQEMQISASDYSQRTLDRAITRRSKNKTNIQNKTRRALTRVRTDHLSTIFSQSTIPS